MSLADDDEAGLASQQRLEAIAKQTMIVRNQNADSLHCLHNILSMDRSRKTDFKARSAVRIRIENQFAA